MAENRPIAVEFRGVAKRFGRLSVLVDVNLTVERGRFLTIFGPNGAGKTTLFGILTGMIRPSAGSVRMNGIDPREGAESIKAQIGVISHSPFLYDDLTAEENLVFYGRMYNVLSLDERVKEVLEQVGLLYRRHDRVGTFSRGMKQRLTIARATLHRPSIFLLDEPYTGLDEAASEMLDRLLREIIRVGERTVFMSTHDLHREIAVSDTMAILGQGRIIYEGDRSTVTPEEFRHVYRSIFTDESF
ncbi:MAG: ABC transporter ATP-binding protein [Candidatus Latescibacteria bacterium]|nr:ABC transporter ATP-binding protein [Candidatus Latescibacterota bacterium]